MKRFSEIERIFKRRYKAFVMSAKYIVKDQGVAEDIVQEVFLRLMENGVEDKKINERYFYIAVRNRALDYASGNKQQTTSTDKLEIEDNSIEMMEREIAYTDKIQEIYDAIEALPPSCREIFKEVYLSRKKYQTVADEMNISLSTVKTQMYRALIRLRKVLILMFLIFIDNN